MARRTTREAHGIREARDHRPGRWNRSAGTRDAALTGHCQEHVLRLVPALSHCGLRRAPRQQACPNGGLESLTESDQRRDQRIWAREFDHLHGSGARRRRLGIERHRGSDCPVRDASPVTIHRAILIVPLRSHSLLQAVLRHRSRRNRAAEMRIPIAAAVARAPDSPAYERDGDGILNTHAYRTGAIPNVSTVAKARPKAIVIAMS